MMRHFKLACKFFKIKHKLIRYSSSIPLMNSPLVVVCGCTGSGKSELGLSIAEEFNGEVVSADSMQIYKGRHKHKPNIGNKYFSYK
jgi:hypothetical protein